MFREPQDVTLAALYVSSKMHDTLKKPREILMVSYGVRFPELAAKSKSIVGEIDMDPQVRATSESGRTTILTLHGSTDRRARPPKVACGRTPDAGDNMFQLYITNALPVCHQDRPGSERWTISFLSVLLPVVSDAQRS